MEQQAGEARRAEYAGTQAIAPESGLPVATTGQDIRPMPRRSMFSVNNAFRMSRITPWIAAQLAQEEAHGLFFLLVPVFCGLGAVLWFCLPSDPSIFAIGAIFVVALLVAIGTGQRDRRLLRMSAALVLVCGGMLLAAYETASRATILLDASVTVDLTGRVAVREAVSGGGWRYTIDVVSTADPVLQRPPRRVALLVRGARAPIEPGEGIAGRARLSPPSGPALPGLSDFSFSSYYSGIGAIGYFYGAPSEVVLGEPGPAGILAAMAHWIGGLRAEIGARIRAVLPGDAGAFATAMVTDERRAMSRATTEALRLSGLAHIIAISGLNMALSAGIFFVGFRMLFSLHQGFAQAFPIKKLAAFGALAGVTAYYMLSGSAVSAERAWLMMSIMLIAVLLDRPSISMRNVALSAMVILVMSPSDVMGAGFQMSFAATAALVAGYALYQRQPSPHDERNLPRWVTALGQTWRFFAGIAITSIIGGLSTAIFSIAHFQQLAVWGLPANLAAMPIVSFIVMPAGLVAMLVMPFGLEAWPLRVMGFGLDLVIAVAREVASWGGDGGVGQWPGPVFALSVAGFIVLVILRTPLRLAGAAILAVALAAGLLWGTGPRPSLLIAGDGSMTGIVRLDGIGTDRPRPPEFIFGQWRRALAASAHVEPVGLAADARKAQGSGGLRTLLDAVQQQAATQDMRRALDDAEPDRFLCVRGAWCVAQSSDGPRIATLEDPAYLRSACAVADLVVTRARLRRASCEQGAIVLTGYTLARTGALSVRFDDEAGNIIWTINAALGARDRAWNRHRFYDWRQNRFIRPDEAIDVNLPDASTDEERKEGGEAAVFPNISDSGE